MINHRGVFLPDGETHLTQWMDKVNIIVDGKPTYQYGKLEKALGYVRNWRTAVDVGAHCGLWSAHLVKRFRCVHAFEPVAAHRECFMANIPNFESTNLYNGLHSCALGEREGKVSIHTSETSSGDSWVSGKGDIPMRRLDELALQDVDFIKLDCEGYELFALRGAEETIKRCHPCVIVEQKPGRAQKFGLPETGAVDYLIGLGAKLRATLSGDFVLSWD
jgi:FkbM family methyltransferase